MIPVTGNVGVDIIAAFATVILLIVTYLKWHYKYWERQNVPYIKPSLIFGNIKDTFLLRKSSGQLFCQFYEEFKKQGHKFGGVFMLTRPSFVITDPELLKIIMVKDFQHFTDRGGTFNINKDPLSANLLNLKGQKWKDLRAKLTPTFTSGKMKFMFQTLVDCSVELGLVLEKLKDQPIDIKEIVARYTTDIIGSCAFGLDCNSLKNPDAEFRKVGKMALHFSTIRAVKRIFTVTFPNFTSALGISISIPYVTKFFQNIVSETIRYREKHKVARKDFIDLMIQQMNKGLVHENESDGLSIDEITAQSFLFFVAGFETSSTTLTFCMFELTQNLDVQEKLRKEIHDILAKHDNQITYDAMTEMKYMDNVISETFRKHPPVPLIARVCTQEYKVPDTNVILKEGSTVFIPILGLHKDPEHYPNPDQFLPDRFNNEEAEKTRHPFTFLPFGEGPRNCIGLRFGLMQIKVALILLLRRNKWTLSKKTKLPLRTKPQNVFNSTIDPIWLQTVKI